MSEHRICEIKRIKRFSKMFISILPQFSSSKESERETQSGEWEGKMKEHANENILIISLGGRSESE